jgi:hypothetical protein
MHRGHRGMYRRTGPPPWVGHGHHGARHGQGCCHHEATPCETACGPQWATTAEEEREFLEDLAEALRRHLGRIERRISELEPSEA